MKLNWNRQALGHIGTALLGVTLATSVSAESNKPTTDFPAVVPFETGMTGFAPGDSITITAVTGTSSTIRTGETYCVEGIYTLSSKAEADIALFATTTTAVSTPTERTQIARVKKGKGSFRLVKPMREEGYLHVSFYPAEGGSSFGGVYFGQGEWLLPKQGWGAVRPQAKGQDKRGARSSYGGLVVLVGPNRVMFNYLGEPVAPPADMVEVYTKAGLVKAIHTAARSAGVTVKRVEIEDSEYPFLVGVVCEEGEFNKVADQLREMPAYEYRGCTSTSTHSAFNLVPYRAYPKDVADRVSHRTGLRTEIFFRKLMGED